MTSVLSDDNSGEISRFLYRLIHRHPTWSLDELAAATNCAPFEAREACQRLASLGLLTEVSTTSSGYTTVDPEVALNRLVEAQEQSAVTHLQRVSVVHESMITLIREFRDLQEQRRDTVEIEILRTPALANAFLDDAGSLAHHRIRSMHPGGPPPEDTLGEMLARDRQVQDRDIRVETLYTHSAAEVPHMAGYLSEATRPGREVRLATHLPLRMLLFDDDLAVLPLDPDDSRKGAIAFHGSELVRSLHSVYDHLWRSATPFRGDADHTSQGPVLGGYDRAIIKMLADGVKDEAIARNLGVSTRTLSRLVAGLLERLGAQTRFQAALRVADLGLLPSNVPAPMRERTVPKPIPEQRRERVSLSGFSKQTVS